MTVRYPQITDNDQSKITATINGDSIRSWTYNDEADRRVKMRAAHEFAEGWFQCALAMSAGSR